MNANGYQINGQYLHSTDRALYAKVEPYLEQKPLDVMATLSVDVPVHLAAEIVSWAAQYYSAMPDGLRPLLTDQVREHLAQQVAAAKRQQAIQVAEQYISQLIETEGLANCEENKNAIVEYIKTNNLPVNVDSVKKAIEALRDQLIWVKDEVLEPLPNGEPRLYLDATPAELRVASVAQLKDLALRQQAEQKKEKGRGGWHGSNFTSGGFNRQ